MRMSNDANHVLHEMKRNVNTALSRYTDKVQHTPVEISTRSATPIIRKQHTEALLLTIALCYEEKLHLFLIRSIQVLLFKHMSELISIDDLELK